MRGLVQTLGRGVVAGLVVVMLAAPMQAKENDGGGSYIERGRQQIVKFLKKLTIRSLGDGLIDPRP